jgi:hypothetical protein
MPLERKANVCHGGVAALDVLMSRDHLPARAYSLRIGLVSATLIALAACGGTGAAASPTAAAASPSAAAASPLVGSSFTSADFAVPVSFSLSGGWKMNNEHPSTIDISRDDQGASAGEFERFTGGMQNAGIHDIGSTTVAGATKDDPRLPWPKDLYAWLKSRPEFKPQSPQAITVGGRPATQIDADVNVQDGTKIELVCSSDSNCWLLDHNDRWRFVEVKNNDGSGVVWITNGIPAPAFDAYATALDQLLGTLAFR